MRPRRSWNGRYLAEIFLPGETVSVNSEMIAAGHAVPYDGGKRG
jgi:endonuclease YncB( thermonuclease family)